MPISELLVTEWDQEGANTRKALERVPAEKWDWKPHPKSGTLGWMASHIATLPHFAITTVKTSEFEIEGGERPKVDGHSRLLPVFDEQLKKGRDALAGVTDEQLRQIWTLKWKGNVLFSMPKYNVIRGMCFNHIIHHRAQLTMYLRSLDIPVPALYGPSADEQNFYVLLRPVSLFRSRRSTMDPPVILSAVRTPVEKFQGGRSSFSAVELGSKAVAG